MVHQSRRLLLAWAVALCGGAIAADKSGASSSASGASGITSGKADGELAIAPHAHPLPATSYVTESIAVTGAVEKPLTLTVADLRKFTLQPPLAVTSSRPSGQQSGDRASQKVYVKGVLLRDILNQAGVVSRDHNDVKKIVVIAIASDGYKVVFSWSELFNSAVGDGVIVYFDKDGAPLGEDEGRIAMISAKDLRTGPRHVKWLQAIEVRKIVE